jgi:hypothetical protein
MTRVRRPKLLAQFLAFVQVAKKGIGEEQLRVTIAGPLKLVVTARHVLDQVLHPEQGMTPISLHGVLLHLSPLTSRKLDSHFTSSHFDR